MSLTNIPAGNVSITSLFFRDLHNLLPTNSTYVVYITFVEFLCAFITYVDSLHALSTNKLLHVAYKWPNTTLPPHVFSEHRNGTVPRSFVISSEIYGLPAELSAPLVFDGTPITLSFTIELVSGAVQQNVFL